MMKLRHMIGVALGVVVAFSANAAAASAAETAQWLAAGAEIGSPLAVKGETITNLLLEDSGIGIAIEMAVTATGTVGPLEADLLEKLTVVSAKLVSKKEGPCEKLEVVEAVDLPWTTELYLAGTAYRDRITAEAEGKAPGWLVQCKALGLKATDTCTGTFSTLMENIGGSKDVDAEVNKESEEESLNCTLGGAKKGLMLTGGTLLISAEAKELEISVSAATAPPPAPRIEKVLFKGDVPILVDHENDEWEEEAFGVNEFGEKEVYWFTNGAGELRKNWPVAYPRNTKVRLEAQFELPLATQTFLKEHHEGNTELTGELNVLTSTLKFTKVLTPAEVTAQLAAHKEYLSTETVESNNALPNVVHLYESVAITWKWKVKEIGRADPFEQQLGRSKHNLYATFGEVREKVIKGSSPYGEGVFFTLLDLDTRGIEAESPAVGEVAPTKTIAGVWRGFSNLVGAELIPTLEIRTYDPATGVITRAGTEPLKYYNVVTPANQTLEAWLATGSGICEFTFVSGLLERGTSQCYAWAAALSYALGTEGVGSNILGIEPEIGKLCGGLVTCYILVKKWKFGVPEPGEPQFPYLPNQVTDEEGTPGQANKNPPAFFVRHFIVEAGEGASRKLYDPSYGSAPIAGENHEETLTKYQEASLAGFCYSVGAEMLCQQTPAALQLKEEVFSSF
jgi:hypothetical protein